MVGVDVGRDTFTSSGASVNSSSVIALSMATIGGNSKAACDPKYLESCDAWSDSDVLERGAGGALVECDAEDLSERVAGESGPSNVANADGVFMMWQKWLLVMRQPRWWITQFPGVSTNVVI